MYIGECIYVRCYLNIHASWAACPIYVTPSIFWQVTIMKTIKIPVQHQISYFLGESGWYFEGEKKADLDFKSKV